MFSALIAGVLLGGGPEFAETRITGATIFRNGYGFVATEAPLSDTGVTYIRALPQAVEGTLWFAPKSGARINEVTLTWVEDAPIEEVAESIPEILALNIGRDVSVWISQNFYSGGVYEGEKMVNLTGKLLHVSREGILLQMVGALQAVDMQQIRRLDGKYGDFKTTAEIRLKSPVLRVHSDPGTKGSIYTVSLVQGINWVPAYEVVLRDGGKMSLTMKATVLNSLGDFNKVDVGLMSGFPQIERIGETDPMTSSLTKILEASEDALRLAMVKGMQAYSGGFGGGGLGGGGAAPGQEEDRKVTRVAYDPSDTSLVVRGDADKLNREFATTESENFFIYGVPLFELKNGERKYLVIDDGELDYAMWHRIESSTSNTDLSVTRHLEFENKLRVPLTRASAIIVRDGQLIGKTSMPYKFMGDTVRLPLGDAPYIKAKVATTPIRTNRAKVKLRDGRVFDEFVRRDTITVLNLSSRASEVEVTHKLRGDSLTLSSPAETTKLPVPDTVNFDYSLTWKKSVEPGATWTETVEYSSFALAKQESGGQ